MFKVQKVEYVNKTFRIPKNLLEELQNYAARNSISVNELVIQCCQYAMDNALDNSEEPSETN